MKTAIKTRLTKNDFAELVEIEERLATLSVEAREAADNCGLSRREIAMRMGNASPSTLQRLLKGMAYNASLDTIARFAWACGYEFQVNLVPRADAKQPQRQDPAAGEARVYWLNQYLNPATARTGTWSGLGPAANNDFRPSEFAFASAEPRTANAH